MAELVPTLVLSDGGLLGALGAAIAREEAIVSGVEVARLGAVVMLRGVGGPTDQREARDRAVLAHAASLALSVWTKPALATVQEGAPPEEREVVELLEASLSAARHGVQRVLWCVGAGTKDSVDVDRLGAITSRAIGVARLVILTSASGNARDFRIETPVADLSDAQAADLVVDLDVDVRGCWWADRATSDEYRRWKSALGAAGWRTPTGAGPS